MDHRFHNQAAEAARQFADQACKAQLASLQRIGEIQQLYIEALASQATSMRDFTTRLLAVHALQDLSALQPDAVGFVRGSVEAACATQQKMLQVTQQATTELGRVMAASAQTANDATRPAWVAVSKRG